jgi:hypothetical protein
MDKDIFVNTNVFVIEKEVGKLGEFLGSNIIIVNITIGTKGERTRL